MRDYLCMSVGTLIPMLDGLCRVVYLLTTEQLVFHSYCGSFGRLEQLWTQDQYRTEEAQRRTSLVTSIREVTQVIDKTLRDVVLGLFVVGVGNGWEESG